MSLFKGAYYYYFSTSSRKRLVSGLFLSQLDYGDTIYRFACPTVLTKLDPLYHAALRYISNAPYRTHHCTLYSLTGWSSLSMRRMQHWFLLMYKAILGKLPLYICVRFAPVCDSYNLRSSAWILLEQNTSATRRSLDEAGSLLN